MAFLIDTSILICRADPSSAQHPAAVAALGGLLSQGETLCLMPQNLTDLWSVFTRAAPPTSNGLGLTVADAEAERVRLMALFTLLPEVPSIQAIWVDLVNRFAVRGRLAHDARLVAGPGCWPTF